VAALLADFASRLPAEIEPLLRRLSRLCSFPRRLPPKDNMQRQVIARVAAPVVRSATGMQRRNFVSGLVNKKNTVRGCGSALAPLCGEYGRE